MYASDSVKKRKILIYNRIIYHLHKIEMLYNYILNNIKMVLMAV